MALKRTQFQIGEVISWCTNIQAICPCVARGGTTIEARATYGTGRSVESYTSLDSTPMIASHVTFATWQQSLTFIPESCSLCFLQYRVLIINKLIRMLDIFILFLFVERYERLGSCLHPGMDISSIQQTQKSRFLTFT